jgi:hypothetical protein
MRFRLMMLALFLLFQGVAFVLPMLLTADAAFPVMVMLVLLAGLFLGHAVLGAPRNGSEP